VAYVYSREKKEWFYFSDTHGAQSALSDVMRSEAYVLFYERREK